MKMNPVSSSDIRTNLTFHTAVEAREYGSNTKDSLSTKQPEKKETWGEFAGRLLCFFPNLLYSGLRKVIYVLSFCTLCRDDLTPAEIQASIKPVIEAWRKKGATEDEKKAALDAWTKKYPTGVQEMKDAFVLLQRRAALGDKGVNDPEKVKAWNEKFAKEKEELAQKRLNNLDVSVFEDYEAYLAVKAKEGESK